MRFLAGLSTFAAFVVCGALTGATVAARLMPRAGDGWTQIADALGGLMLGALLGGVIGGVLAVRFGTAALWRAAAGATLGAVVVFALLVVTNPRRGGAGSTDALPSGAPTTPTPEPPTPESPIPESPTALGT
ncbi:MAG: hypothetical protein AAGC60_04665 [Acidobacteriota bacterium]